MQLLGVADRLAAWAASVVNQLAAGAMSRLHAESLRIPRRESERDLLMFVPESSWP
jgi:hypothetical protein